MATYAIQAHSWGNSYLQLGEVRLMVAVVYLDCGTPLHDGDTVTGLNATLTDFPDYIACHGTYVYSNLCLREGKWAYGANVSARTAASVGGLTIRYTLGQPSGAITNYLGAIGPINAATYFKSAIPSTIYGQDTAAIFGPTILIYDTQAQSFIGMAVSYGVWESSTDFDNNGIGINDIFGDNAMPYAVIQPTGRTTRDSGTVRINETMSYILNESIRKLDNDPYEQGGTSGTGGGTGTFSDTGDTIGVPSLPTLSAVDTGFISLFNPSASQIKALANYMWSSSFDLATFKNVVANPIDCILGLTIVPVDPPNAGNKTLTVGNIATDVSMPYLSSQYVEVDCGTLNIAEFWGSYLDYSPYTKIQLYLPYIGIVPVDIDDMQNSTIRVVYHVDVLSGACVAYVLCGGTQLYTYIGQCSSNVPVTSNDFTNTVNGILNIAGAVGSLVATEGATAPQAVGTIASSAVNMLKPNIQKSGSLSGTGGMLGVQTPYLICQRPRQSVPASQNHFTGYPSNITYTLSDLTGYTEVQNVHLDNVPCTDAEMNEILEYLTGGVVI